EAALEIVCFDHWYKRAKDAGDGLPFTGGDDAVGKCRGDRLPIAAAMSAALSIGDSANLTARSRQGGRMRSRQSLSAVGSPASANSTALRVKASASPWSKI